MTLFAAIVPFEIISLHYGLSLVMTAPHFGPVSQLCMSCNTISCSQ